MFPVPGTAKLNSIHFWHQIVFFLYLYTSDRILSFLATAAHIHTYRKQSNAAQWIISIDIRPIFFCRNKTYTLSIFLFYNLNFTFRLILHFVFNLLSVNEMILWQWIVKVRQMQMGVSVWTIVASVCLAAQQVAIDVMAQCDCLWNRGQWCRSISVPHAGRTRKLPLRNRPESGWRDGKGWKKKWSRQMQLCFSVLE